MYKHPSTQAILTFYEFGNTIIPAESGELASGFQEKDEWQNQKNIVFFEARSRINSPKGKILITAGPTYEAIDPVRFIGNHSSGKMGFDIARVLLI
jgi:phosphopantothenoylcysteine decarboxylase/phosphopantothenate--cysteine ligase